MLSEHYSFDKVTPSTTNNAEVEKKENEVVHVRHVLTPSPRVSSHSGRTDQYPVTARSVLSSLPFRAHIHMRSLGSGRPTRRNDRPRTTGTSFEFSDSTRILSPPTKRSSAEFYVQEIPTVRTGPIVLR